MTVQELIDRLAECDPKALVLLWSTDPNDAYSEGWYPAGSVEEDTAVKSDEGDWMSGHNYTEQAVPAVWLRGEGER
jgi:hypothetical protein